MHVCYILLVTTFLIVLFVEDSTQKVICLIIQINVLQCLTFLKIRKTVFPHDFRYDFNNKLVNMTVDLSNWILKTRKDPPVVSPKIEVWLFKDLTNALVSSNVNLIKWKFIILLFSLILKLCISNQAVFCWSRLSMFVTFQNYVTICCPRTYLKKLIEMLILN